MERTLEFAKQRSYLRWEGIIDNAIGAVLTNKSPQQAIQYLNRAAKIKIKLSDSIGLGIVYSNLSGVYSKKMNLRKIMHK